MSKIFERPAFAIAALILLSLYLFFFQLGGMALTDPDESFYAQTSKEMLGRGEWLTPYLYGEPQFEKPILFYWMVEASFKVFGVNEFAARFPSAILGLAGIIAVYFLGSRLFSKRAGAMAALILAANVEYIMLSRACVTDMALSTLMLAGFLFFYLAYDSREKKVYLYLLSAAAFALATLTKGPIALILAAGIIFLFLAFTRNLSRLRDMPLFRMALVFAAIAVPWYAVMYKIHGKAFTDAFFGFQNVTRFLKSEHKIGSQFYYNIPVVLGGMFPWSAFLPLGLWKAFKNAKTAGSVFLLSWFFVIFIFFSISSTKLPTYIFPCFPALALIVAMVWDDFLNRKAGGEPSKGMTFSYYLLIAAIFIGALALGIFMMKDMEYRWILNDTVPVAILLLFGMGLSLISFRTRRYLGSFFLIAYAVIIAIYPLNGLVLPHIEVYETSKNISEEALKRMGPEDPIGCEYDYRAGVAFYTGKVPADIDRHHLLTRFLTTERRVWCVMKEKNFHELYDLDHDLYYSRPSYLVYRLGKKCLFTNKVPADGKYLLKREGKR